MKAFTVFDFETAFPSFPCQIGITTIVDGVITDSFMRYIQPPVNKYSDVCMAVHGITPEVTKNAPFFPEVWEEIKQYFKNTTIVAHNLPFDLNVLQTALEHYNIDFDFPNVDAVDTCQLLGRKKLNVLCYQYGIEIGNHHNALDDSLACAKLLLAHLQGKEPIRTDEPADEAPIVIPQHQYHQAITGDVLKKDLSKANPDNPFYDKKVVITGVFSMDRKEVASILKTLGADVDTSITKRTNFVCIGKDAGPKKLKTIQELNEKGCNIVTIYEEELFNLFKKWNTPE